MAKKRILVVDDDPTVCLAVAGMLGAAGYAVASAADGRAALTALKTNRPDLVVIDLLLPGLSGQQLIMLTKRDQTLGLPVVVITGRTDENVLKAAQDAGADEVLRKPIDSKLLVRPVSELLTIAEQSVPPPTA